MSYNGISFQKKIIDPGIHLRTTGLDEVEIEEKIVKNDPVYVVKTKNIRFINFINR